MTDVNGGRSGERNDKRIANSGNGKIETESSGLGFVDVGETTRNPMTS